MIRLSFMLVTKLKSRSVHFAAAALGSWSLNSVSEHPLTDIGETNIFYFFATTGIEPNVSPFKTVNI